jgi:hypothetical protein
LLLRTQGAADPASANRGWTGIEHGDIRFDEDYARFYEAYSGQRKLPPPVEGRTLYSELGLLQQKQQLLAQQTNMLSSATPPPNPALLMAGGLTPGGEPLLLLPSLLLLLLLAGSVGFCWAARLCWALTVSHMWPPHLQLLKAAAAAAFSNTLRADCYLFWLFTRVCALRAGLETIAEQGPNSGLVQAFQQLSE